MISTKGRYAIRVMLDLAERRNGTYIPMKEVAERQEVSLKYIERIMPDLAKARFVEGLHGKGGGYRLLCEPDACTVGAILRATEGELAPVSCLACGAAPCTRAPFCKTLPMWKQYYEMTVRYFDGITLSDLLKSDVSGDFCI